MRFLLHVAVLCLLASCCTGARHPLMRSILDSAGTDLGARKLLQGE
jgi:hypothetical protein